MTPRKPRLTITAAASALVMVLLSVVAPGVAHASPVPVAQTTPTLPAALNPPANPIVPATSAGYLGDTWSVAPSGAFTDSIPLEVPAGRAGMAPSLALNYASNGEDGLVGVGWTISGATSRITRCGRTLSTEGTVTGVRYDTSDRYCLDGQKLIAVGAIDYGSGDYGDIDTQYRTETDQFAQIISTGSGQTIATGPDVFLVRTKNGLVLTYTAQTATRTTSGVGYSGGLTEATDSTTTPRTVWLLTSEADRSGNEIRYTYVGSAAAGDYRPDRITYTYNTGVLPGLRYVQFVYENRPDASVGYQNGVRYTLPQRIKSIAMYAPNPSATVQVWRYDLGYITSGTGRSLLTSLTRCVPSGACMKAKQFDWYNPSAVPGFTPQNGAQAIVTTGATRPAAMSVLDVNGDGLDDAIFALGGNDDASDPVNLRLGSRGANGVPVPMTNLYQLTGNGLPANTAVASSRPLDLNGDGKADYDAKYVDAAGWHDTVMTWNAAQQKLVSTGVSMGIGSTTDFADVNGDGLLDMIGGSTVALNQNFAFASPQPMPIASSCSRSVGDVDGDGRADIVFAEQSGRTCLTNTWMLTVDDAGTVSKTAASFMNAGGTTFYRHVPSPLPGYLVKQGDFNGDGLTDSLLLPTDAAQPARIAWNTGAGLDLDAHTIIIPRDSFNDVRVADINGDGRADLLAFTTSITAMISMGDGTFASGVISPTAGFIDPKFGRTTTQLGDFNGDGRLDVVRIVGGLWNFLLQDASVPVDRLKSIRDEGTTIARQTVTYNTVWTDHPEKLTNYTCVYPLVCARHGILVVRRVDSTEHNVDVTPANATTRSTYYSYEDPVADLRGRGFLGFTTFRVWDPSRPVETITTFNQRGQINGRYYPEVGRPVDVLTVVPILTAAQTAAQVPSAQARVIENSYTYTVDEANNATTYAVSLLHSQSQEWEQVVSIDWSTLGGNNPHTTHTSGMVVPAKVDREVDGDYTVDAYGNVTSSTQATVNGGTETSTATYDIRPDDWLVDLVATSTETSAVGGAVPATVSRHVDNHYDGLGRLDSTTIEKGNADPSLTSTTTYAYDSYGVVESKTVSTAGRPDQVTHVDYTPLLAGQPDEEVYPSLTWSEHNVLANRPAQWALVEPAYGVTVATEDANGVIDTSTFDDFGRPVTTQVKGQAAVTYTYGTRSDAGGGTNGMVLTRASNGSSATTYTDRLGRTVATATTGFDGTANLSETTYDLLGHTASVSRPHKAGGPVALSKSTYDSLDRVLTQTAPNGAVKTYSYTFYTTHVVDASNQVTDTTMNVDGEVIASTGYAGGNAVKTTYTYAPFGQMRTSTDASGNMTSFMYDTLGRRVQVASPDTGVTTTTYYGTGLIHTETHVGTGVTATYAYDDLGRKVSTVTPDGTTSFTWDSTPYGIGQMATATSAYGIVTNFRYDDAERAVSVDYVDQSDNNTTYTMDRQYNAAGQLTGLAYPDPSGNNRFGLGYTYTAHGDLQTISQVVNGAATTALWTVQSRNPDSSLNGGVLGANGQIGIGRGEDPQTGRVTGVAAVVGGQALLNVGYQYYANGLVKSRNEQDATITRAETYHYDTLNRLTGWDLTDGALPTTSTAYQYDPIGDMTTRSGGPAGALDERTYGGPNNTVPHELTSRDATVGGGELNTYVYDQQGRLTRTLAEDGSVEQQITYTPFDLPKIVRQGAQSWTFAYDAFGRRVKKSGPDGVTFTVPGAYDRRTVGGVTTYVYSVQGPDGPVAQVVSDGVTLTPEYLVTDGVGSVTTVISEAGTVTKALYYDPFGNRVNADGTAFSGSAGDVRTGFTGQEHDDDLGLINMKGRVYSPGTDRFATGDPVVGDAYTGLAWNPYSYVMNSPLNLTDPSGFIYSTCASFMPCASESGGGDFGSSGGYNDGAFNPSLGDEDGGWKAREFQRDMADFFHAAEAYGEGGVAGLAAYERGDLARAVKALAAEWGPGGYMAQAAALHAATSDSAGVHVTFGPINVETIEPCDPSKTDTCDPDVLAKRAADAAEAAARVTTVCGDWQALSGTGASVQMCVTYGQWGSYGTLNFANQRPDDVILSDITMNSLNEDTMGRPIESDCAGTTVGFGESGSCTSTMSSDPRGGAYATVTYWNPLTESFVTRQVGFEERSSKGQDLYGNY